MNVTLPHDFKAEFTSCCIIQLSLFTWPATWISPARSQGEVQGPGAEPVGLSPSQAGQPLLTHCGSFCGMKDRRPVVGLGLGIILAKSLPPTKDIEILMWIGKS